MQIPPCQGDRLPVQPLGRRLRDVRAETMTLCEGLSDADATVQSMDDASPVKWHLAHTTWFFDEFVLSDARTRWRTPDPRYRYLFNSYYESVGARHPRPRRGLLTRPSLAEVVAYRRAVDDALDDLLAGPQDEVVAARIELGVQHEQQHQELILTDLLHLFAQNPLRPAHRATRVQGPPEPAPPLAWVAMPGGETSVGDTGRSFAFDCERPRHRVLLAPHSLASRPATNAEWREFIDDGGYRDARLWLSDGWARAQAEGWGAPMHWIEREGEWSQMTLAGELALDPHAPVTHVSYYEADAYARWRGARLPTEQEWEAAAATRPLAGHFASSRWWRPRSAAHDPQRPLRQLFGDVWEWTSSAFAPYPGFRTEPGAIGEYNGKFMCGQYVLRGGSCATPDGHVRASYRNFFHPHQRWQFSGVRLARDAG